MNQMKAAKRREEIRPGRKGLLPKAAKRQQNLAQGISPGFDFRADTSREGAADAANLPPLRGCDMDEHEPSARALGYLLSPLRGETIHSHL